MGAHPLHALEVCAKHDAIALSSCKTFYSLWLLISMMEWTDDGTLHLVWIIRTTYGNIDLKIQCNLMFMIEHEVYQKTCLNWSHLVGLSPVFNILEPSCRLVSSFKHFQWKWKEMLADREAFAHTFATCVSECVWGRGERVKSSSSSITFIHSKD